MNLSFMEPMCFTGSVVDSGKHRLILLAMRVSVFYFLICCGTMQLLTAHPGKSQELKEITLTMGAGKESLLSVLKKIETKTGLSFVIPLDEVETYTSISFPGGKRSVKETLDIALKNTSLGYRQINSRTVLVYVIKKDKEEKICRALCCPCPSRICSACLYMSSKGG